MGLTVWMIMLGERFEVRLVHTLQLGPIFKRCAADKGHKSPGVCCENLIRVCPSRLMLKR
jgi:hypothetical protein